MKHKIVFLEDVINGTFEVDAISKAGEYWNVIKEELHDDGIATFITDCTLWSINKKKVPQYLDKERIRYNELKMEYNSHND